MKKLAFLAALAVAGALQAQEYPTKPINMIAPFPPGGVADIVGRPLAAAMEKTLKQPVLVVNRSGAGGAVVPARRRPPPRTPANPRPSRRARRGSPGHTTALGGDAHQPHTSSLGSPRDRGRGGASRGPRLGGWNLRDAGPPATARAGRGCRAPLHDEVPRRPWGRAGGRARLSEAR